MLASSAMASKTLTVLALSCFFCGSASGSVSSAANHRRHQLRSRGSHGADAAPAALDAMLRAEREAMDPGDPLSRLKEQLAATEWLEERLEKMDEGLSENAYRAKVAGAADKLARDTSPNFARMLSDMRLEMHGLAAPFYEKELQTHLEEVRGRKRDLLSQIELAGNTTAANATIGSLRKRAEAPPQEDAKESKWDWLIAATAVVLLVILVAGGIILTHRPAVPSREGA
eukprot:TRINITY_DN27524_c0_g2_i1.p1 TRINITY_DN27524_c0_g2~~TRINITY_DN27524_c0_g2_i1.p1  ORF type:complete len:229 (-),score=46.59 TRINITY_DN27524_c0_g2_i1:70-756(-)